MAGADVTKVHDKLFAKEKKAKSAHEEKFFAESKVRISILEIGVIFNALIEEGSIQGET